MCESQVVGPGCSPSCSEEFASCGIRGAPRGPLLCGTLQRALAGSSVLKRQVLWLATSQVRAFRLPLMARAGSHRWRKVRAMRV